MKQILVVDDNPANLTIVREGLKAKYKVTLVSSGEQALTFLGKHLPDLILLDNLMPGMDGIETLSRINELEERPWKVYFLTACVDDKLIQAAKDLGAEGYIEKPFKFNELTKVVAEAIGE